MVKSHTLDDLLRVMFQTYKLSEVEVQLLEAVKNLEDSEECVQAAHVILGAVKPFYAHLPSNFGADAEDATAFTENQAIDANSPEQKMPSGGDESAELAIAPLSSRSSQPPSHILAHQER